MMLCMRSQDALICILVCVLTGLFAVDSISASEHHAPDTSTETVDLQRLEIRHLNVIPEQAPSCLPDEQWVGDECLERGPVVAAYQWPELWHRHCRQVTSDGRLTFGPARTTVYSCPLGAVCWPDTTLPATDTLPRRRRIWCFRRFAHGPEWDLERPIAREVLYSHRLRGWLRRPGRWTRPAKENEVVPLYHDRNSP